LLEGFNGAFDFDLMKDGREVRGILQREGERGMATSFVEGEGAFVSGDRGRMSDGL
jgi:hypothetical protein